MNLRLEAAKNKIKLNVILSSYSEYFYLFLLRAQFDVIVDVNFATTAAESLLFLNHIYSKATNGLATLDDLSFVINLPSTAINSLI